jgi:regulation of enolase protein 1 (concanavalin A-like superfamily)
VLGFTGGDKHTKADARRTDSNDLLTHLSAEGYPLPQSIRDGDRLTILAPAGTDLFIDPSDTPAEPPSVGRLVVPVAGDFIFRAKVEVDFQSTFDAGVLYVEHDENTWFKLCLEFTPQGQPSIVSVVTRGVSDDANSWLVDTPSSYLRVSRQGSGFALHASVDAQWWSLVRHFSLGLAPTAPVKVGLLAQSPTGTGCSAVFSEVSLQSATLGDIRDGH